jgi:hypothetical protein
LKRLCRIGALTRAIGRLAGKSFENRARNGQERIVQRAGSTRDLPHDEPDIALRDDELAFGRALCGRIRRRRR